MILTREKTIGKTLIKRARLIYRFYLIILAFLFLYFFIFIFIIFTPFKVIDISDNNSLASSPRFIKKNPSLFIRRSK
jgi:hypothetical protein